MASISINSRSTNEISANCADNSFLPIYYLCRLLGTTALFRRSRHSLKYKVSVFASLYMILCICLAILSCHMVINFFNTVEVYVATPKSKGSIYFPIYMEPVATCIVNAVITMNLLLKSAQIVTLLQTIHNFDNANVGICMSLHNESFNFCLALSIAYPLMYLLVKIIRHIHDILNINVLITFFLVDLSHMSTMSAEAQFLALCYLVKQRYKMLNSKLEYICSSGYHILWKQESKWSHNEVQDFNGKLPHTLELIRKSHIQLYDMIEQLNCIYGVQFFFLIVINFIQIPTNMYNVAKLKNGDMTLTITMSIWCLSFIIRFFMALKMCSLTTYEASRSSIIVENMKRRLLQPDFKEELLLFSRHLANLQVSFTACGFFKMDMPLLITVIAAGCTYLVIMIQM